MSFQQQTSPGLTESPPLVTLTQQDADSCEATVNLVEEASIVELQEPEEIIKDLKQEFQVKLDYKKDRSKYLSKALKVENSKPKPLVM